MITLVSKVLYNVSCLSPLSGDHREAHLLNLHSPDDENAEPSLEEMAIDDSLPMLVRLKKYVVSNLFLHRYVNVKLTTKVYIVMCCI
jgi:hypothetical protein